MSATERASFRLTCEPLLVPHPCLYCLLLRQLKLRLTALLALTVSSFLAPACVTSLAYVTLAFHHFHHRYERIAHYANVYHTGVHSTEYPKDMREKHPEYFTLNCERMRSLEIPARPPCWNIVKNLVVVVPLREFEVALAGSLDFIDRTPLLLDGEP